MSAFIADIAATNKAGPLAFEKTGYIYIYSILSER